MSVCDSAVAVLTPPTVCGIVGASSAGVSSVSTTTDRGAFKIEGPTSVRTLVSVTTTGGAFNIEGPTSVALTLVSVSGGGEGCDRHDRSDFEGESSGAVLVS
jgi:hypothetical protein